MSYTMTIESPEKAAWFEERYSQLSQEQLGALFVSLLMQTRSETVEKDDYIRQRDAILAVAGGWKDDRTEGDFSRFAGRWSAEEAQIFDEATERVQETASKVACGSRAQVNNA